MELGKLWSHPAPFFRGAGALNPKGIIASLAFTMSSRPPSSGNCVHAHLANISLHREIHSFSLSPRRSSSARRGRVSIMPMRTPFRYDPWTRSRSRRTPGGILSLVALIPILILASGPLAMEHKKPVPERAVGRETAERLRHFLLRFASAVPDIAVTLEPDTGQAPTGFSLIRYEVRSSRSELDEVSAVLLSEGEDAVFIGHAMLLPEGVADARSPDGPSRLSAFFSQKAGRPMDVSWKARPGPGGAFQAVIGVETPFGKIETTGALSKDSRWFLFGTFFPLNEDPRKVRVRRLAPEGRPALGPSAARVNLIEISDFQCPRCAEIQPLLESMVEKYAGEVRLVRIDYPQWQVHDWGATAAEWCLCAGRLDPRAYWPLSREIFARQGSITSANFADVVLPKIMALGLKRDSLEECVSGKDAPASVLADIGRVSSIGVSGTPSLLVNGELVEKDIGGLLEPAILRALRDTGPRRSRGRP